MSMVAESESSSEGVYNSNEDEVFGILHRHKFSRNALFEVFATNHPFTKF